MEGNRGCLGLKRREAFMYARCHFIALLRITSQTTTSIEITLHRIQVERGNANLELSSVDHIAIYILLLFYVCMCGGISFYQSATILKCGNKIKFQSLFKIHRMCISVTQTQIHSYLHHLSDDCWSGFGFKYTNSMYIFLVSDCGVQ